MSKTEQLEVEVTKKPRHPYVDDTCPACDGIGTIEHEDAGGNLYEVVCYLCNGTRHYKR